MTAIPAAAAPRPSLKERLTRASGWAAGSHLISQSLRLASNLILTRLLVPEDFGLMALVVAILVGMQMLSDIGIAPAIMANDKGDDPRFLDTAWTIQIIRGILLWSMVAALAYPVSIFFEEPHLAWMLPVAGLSMMITGFSPTRIDTANRHLMPGRVIALDLTSQVAGISATVLLAWLRPDVSSLVWGMIVSAVIRLTLMNLFLPGRRNSLAWDRDSASTLIHFGKWIFVSTLLTFLLTQGDKLVLGRLMSFHALGIYNIGYFFAGFPLTFGYALTGKLMIPFYRESAPGRSAENFRRARIVRFALSGAVLSMVWFLTLAGPLIIDLLYDERYGKAGPVLVLTALALAPQMIGLTYNDAALAASDSRGHFFTVAVRSLSYIVAITFGAYYYEAFGAILGVGIAGLIGYGAVLSLARRHGAWDPLHDAAMYATTVLVGAIGLYLHWERIVDLAVNGIG